MKLEMSHLGIICCDYPALDLERTSEMPLCSGSASNDLTVDQMNPLSELVQGSKRCCSSAGNWACVEVGAALHLRVKSDSSVPAGGGGGFISKYPSSELIPGRDRDFQLAFG